MQKIKFWVGNEDTLQEIIKGEKRSIYKTFDKCICDFLSELSKEIMNDAEAKKYSDVIAFAFWCRKSNVNTLKQKNEDEKERYGRGLVFHIAPSNVPVNAFFTLVFGLLAGNVNVVRVPTKEFVQIRIISKCLNRIIERNYKFLEKSICIISYDRDSEWNKALSDVCNARVIWGGDETIQQIVKNPLSPRAIDLHFSDRYSFAVLSSEAVLKASEEEIKSLARNFYNDTYLMDQNACSSPHTIFWMKDTIYDNQAKERFYYSIFEEAKKYDLADIKCTEKYTLATEYIMRYPEIINLKKYENRMYLLRMEKIPKELEQIRGKYGVFFECDIERINEISEFITEKTQTCLYFGLEAKKIWEEFSQANVKGIDRIVPIGQGLNITVDWDGFNVINELSRIIVLE